MDILFTSNLSGLGGGETSILSIMEKINENYRVVLLCDTYGEFPLAAQNAGIEVVIDHFKRKNIFHTYVNFRKLLKKYNFGVIHNNECSAALLFGMMSGKNIKNFWTCHGQWYAFSKIKVWLINHLLNKIFCVSKNVYDNLKRQDVRNIHLSYLGVDLHSTEHERLNILRNELKIEPHSVLIATIARYEKVKGQKKAVEGLEKILNTDKNIHYVLIGGTVFGNKEDVVYKDETIAFIENLECKNQIHVMAERKDMYNIYPDIDLLLVPSDRESLSMVTLEAISNGIPVITTPCQGPEEILNNNVNMVCNKNSPDAIEEAVRKFLYNSKVNEAIHNDTLYLKQELAKRFDIENVSNIYLRYFLE